MKRLIDETIWQDTLELTCSSLHTCVARAIKRVRVLSIWLFIFARILARSRSNVKFALERLLDKAIWQSTWASILASDRINVHVCSEAFAQFGNLVRHVRLHAGAFTHKSAIARKRTNLAALYPLTSELKSVRIFVDFFLPSIRVSLQRLSRISIALSFASHIENQSEFCSISLKFTYGIYYRSVSFYSSDLHKVYN